MYMDTDLHIWPDTVFLDFHSCAVGIPMLTATLEHFQYSKLGEKYVSKNVNKYPLRRLAYQDSWLHIGTRRADGL